MPLFEPDMFFGPMDVDWAYVASLSQDVADILSEAEWVHVRAEGTDIEFSIKDRKAIADTGLFHQEGQYGNLPAGEAFVAPYHITPSSTYHILPPIIFRATIIVALLSFY